MQSTRQKISQKFNDLKPVLVAVGGLSVLCSAVYYRGKSDGKVIVLVGADDEGKLQSIEF